MPRTAYGHHYRVERLKLLASDPDCAHGCGRPATEADHQPPLSLHIHVAGSGCCVLVPSCLWCRQRQAAALSRRAPLLLPEVIPEPVGFDVDDAIWDVPWLDDLRDVPDDGWWPRLMTAPHARAEGSIGVELVEWVRVELGITLRWWQRLFAVRLLEVDAAGLLVWTTALLTLARQCGKSLFVYALCEWRSEQAARFGEPQLVLHTADSLEHAKAVWQRAVLRANAHGWPKPRLAAGEYAIFKPDGEWFVRSQTAAVGYTASLAVADECHGVKVETIEQRMGATTIEAAQSQMLLVSTASSTCTELFPLRREGALARLGEPDNELLVEWSAPRGVSVLDPVARRQGSPHWHLRRADEIRAHAERAAPYEGQPYPHDLVVGQRTQFHNEWPPAGAGAAKGAPLVEADRWAGAVCNLDSSGPLVIAVEDQSGHGAAVAFCGLLDDGRFVIGGMLCGSRAKAYEVAAAAATGRDRSTLVVGASLFADPEVAAMPVSQRLKAGANTDTPAALVNLRELLSTGRAVHDDVSPALDDQIGEARVRSASGGLALIPGGRSDLLRAAVWALRVASTQPAVIPAIH